MQTEIPIESAGPSASFGGHKKVVDDIVLVRIALVKSWLIRISLRQRGRPNLSRVLAKLSEVDWLVEVESAGGGDLCAIVAVNVDVVEINTGACERPRKRNL